jgi:hypothetical protein
MNRIKNKIKKNVKKFLHEDSGNKILSNKEQHTFDI